MTSKFIHTHLSVDCVIFGFDNDQLKILLVQKDGDNKTTKLKLPGSLIYDDEDVDQAAFRVLYELTGIKKIPLKQFRCFSSPDRTGNPKDRAWLDKTYQPNINRLISIAYVALCKINRKLNKGDKYKRTEWCPINEIPELPFDHNLMVESSLEEIRRWVKHHPEIVFELLPHKFKMSQLHHLYETIFNKRIDIRNFYKKIGGISYVTELDEKEVGVPHRSAHYYKFDKVKYNKTKATI